MGATVKPEFVVERQGRKFVLYSGLLDLGHAQGLRAIRTRLVQVPSEENGQLAIVSAEVETDRGTFAGIGDASPANVSRAMLNCTIRLAETRAKARALRDAVNVGVAALEEGDEQANVDVDGDRAASEIREHANQPNPPAAARPVAAASQSARAAPNQQAQAPRSDALATPAQIRAIYSIGRDQHSLSEEEVDDRSQTLFGAPPAELTKKQASDLITSLKGGGR